MCLDRLWDPYETPRGVLSVRSMLSVPITNACMASQNIGSVLAFELNGSSLVESKYSPFVQPRRKTAT